MSRTNQKKASIPISPIPLISKDQFSSLPEKTQRQYIENIKSGFIENYLQAVEAVKKWKSLPIQEKLTGLLVPLVLYNRFSPFGVDPFDTPIPFIVEFVDIEKELDLKRLDYDKERYDLGVTDRRGHGPEENTILDLSSRIWIKDESESDLKIPEVVSTDPILTAGTVSLEEYYEKWLPSLDEEKIQSKDLLDQVLVALTIKKAQNEDKKAIETLYGLYRGATEELAIKFACNFKVCLFGKERVQHAQWQKTVDGLIAEAQRFLRFVITGFSLKDIINQLGVPDLSTVIPDTERVIQNIPPWMRHCFIYYLSEDIPMRMEKNIREKQRNQALIEELSKLPGDDGRNQVEEDIRLLRTRNAFLDFQWAGILNPYAPFQPTTGWRTLKRWNWFNSYTFRPGWKGIKMGPRWNLTTWLFGHKNEIDMLAPRKREDGTFGKAWRPTGKILQFLMKKYYEPFKSKRNEGTDFDFIDDFHEDHEEGLGFKDKSKALRDPKDNPEEKREKAENKAEIAAAIKKGLLALGVRDHNLDRNIEKIYLPWKGGLRQKEIAQDPDLPCERQIGNICREIDRVIPRLRKLFPKFPLEQ